MEITRFIINGLHGRSSIDIPIEHNKLILVGENGSGKTTIINIVYCFLSRQWDRLLNYHFESIETYIDGQPVFLTRDLLQKQRKFDRYSYEILGRRFGRVKMERLRGAIDRLGPNRIINDRSTLFSISEDSGIPVTVLIEILEGASQEDLPFPEDLRVISKIISSAFQGQVLYLPTYRRIEQDLKTILPWLDVDEQFRNARLLGGRSTNEFIELVQFGMEDVEQRLKQKMDQLKDTVTTRLRKLTGSYLREVISGQYRTVEASSLENLRTEAIDSIFSRIGEDILPESEKETLRKILKETQKTGRLKEDQKVIAHFLLKLIDVQNAQQNEEENIRRFVGICNGYLSGKQLIFDNHGFNIIIALTSPNSNEEVLLDSIKMKQLSSGEKQIVSLFSHLFLSDTKDFFVLIDEPELSLSVTWQKKFLPDILATGYCSGLVAVTHSPFIFANDLDPYTHTINDFWH